jgi:hypothetical protein
MRYQHATPHTPSGSWTIEFPDSDWGVFTALARRFDMNTFRVSQSPDDTASPGTPNWVLFTYAEDAIEVTYDPMDRILTYRRHAEETGDVVFVSDLSLATGRCGTVGRPRNVDVEVAMVLAGVLARALADKEGTASS